MKKQNKRIKTKIDATNKRKSYLDERFFTVITKIGAINKRKSYNKSLNFFL